MKKAKLEIWEHEKEQLLNLLHWAVMHMGLNEGAANNAALFANRINALEFKEEEKEIKK